jgi:hypothetical protein
MASSYARSLCKSRDILFTVVKAEKRREEKAVR